MLHMMLRSRGKRVPPLDRWKPPLVLKLKAAELGDVGALRKSNTEAPSCWRSTAQPTLSFDTSEVAQHKIHIGAHEDRPDYPNVYKGQSRCRPTGSQTCAWEPRWHAMTDTVCHRHLHACVYHPPLGGSVQSFTEPHAKMATNRQEQGRTRNALAPVLMPWGEAGAERYINAACPADAAAAAAAAPLPGDWVRSCCCMGMGVAVLHPLAAMGMPLNRRRVAGLLASSLSPTA